MKLIDFGINKKLNEFTKFKTYKVTLKTMASEILKKNVENKEEAKIKEYDDKCDLWSIGIIIYELYFKRPKYKGINENIVLNSIKTYGQKLLKKQDSTN